MAHSDALLVALGPVLRQLSNCDPSQPGLADQLNRELPPDGEQLAPVRELLRAGLSEGWLCPRGTPGMSFGRVSKATPESHGFSIDAVHMNQPGPGHTHPKGESVLCFAISGNPRFDGREPGWTCYPPGSWHIPTVSDGEMVILYFLPDGAIRFEPKPTDA